MVVNAVQTPLGPRLGAQVPLAVCLQREQSMTRVARVFGNSLGIPLTPPGIDVLEGRKLGPNDVLDCTHSPL